MTFTVFLNNHADILADLLQLYYPNGAKVIDVTYGTGALWWKVLETPHLTSLYNITACDAQPNHKRETTETIHQRNIFTDDYTEFGLFNALIFDPPYLIGRNSFDYSAKIDKQGSLVPMQYQGKRSWSADDLHKYTSNQTVEFFNKRVECLKGVASKILKPNGLILVKVMDVRHDGQLIPHHINITNILQEGNKFKLIDHGIYIRQGATTWKVKEHLQNLHGHWLIYKKNSSNIDNQTLLS